MAKYSVETMSLYCITHSHKDNKMKNFFKKIADALDTFNRARAAAYFSRMGRDDLAKKIMTE
jgi:hypothetical protein